MVGVRDEGEEEDQDSASSPDKRKGHREYLSAPREEPNKWREENSCLVTQSPSSTLLSREGHLYCH